MSNEWGRIDDDGTVYLRTADGERVIGSWHAGPPEDGIEFYARRYAELAAEVGLLEGRAKSSASDPTAVGTAARKLKEVIPSAAAMGDLDALMTRLDGVLATIAERQAARAKQRSAAAAAAADQKRALVAEAQKLSTSNSWKVSGERYRAIVEEWKAIRGVDRKTDAKLWEQLSQARRQFDSRRRAHFAAVEEQRGVAAERKTKLAGEAEKLATSTEWTPTARRFRDMMAEWKAAGRAARDAEEELWQRFKTAQDAFFTRRSETLAKRDSELNTNLDAKKALIAEAEALDASADPDGARKRLRSIHDRWEKIGHVPRDAKDKLEDRLAEVERGIREATAAGRTVIVTESPLIIRLRESVGKLEARLGRAQAAGDDKLAAETQASLSTQREWLAQAEAATD
ncbi:MAG TPA: DUF349 domain-containing protein [Mycobacteriales bacterium]|jgi:hypothetical protein|nr:DUF349 domain-containing protein [Mycobacteriales bacterium]